MLGKMESEILAMPLDEFARWVVYLNTYAPNYEPTARAVLMTLPKRTF